MKGLYCVKTSSRAYLERSGIEQCTRAHIASKQEHHGRQRVLFNQLSQPLGKEVLSSHGESYANEKAHLKELRKRNLEITWVEGAPRELDGRVLLIQRSSIILKRFSIPTAQEMQVNVRQQEPAPRR